MRKKSKKRKADLLSESAVKCRKLADLFQRQESLQSVSVASQNPEAANQLNTASKLSINNVMSPDNKVIQSLSLLTDANEPEAQPSGSSLTVSNTTVARTRC